MSEATVEEASEGTIEVSALTRRIDHQIMD